MTKGFLNELMNALVDGTISGNGTDDGMTLIPWSCETFPSLALSKTLSIKENI